MFPEGDIAAPVFAPPWHLATIGAAHAWGNASSDRYSDAWERHVASVLAAFHEIQDLLTRGLGFDASISAMLFEDWHQRERKRGRGPETPADLALVISVSAFGKRLSVDDGDGWRLFLESAARRQLAMLLEGLVVAETAALEHGRVVDDGAIREVLERGIRIGGGVAPFRSDDVVFEAAREWLREEPLTARGFGAEFKAVLRERLSRFAAGG